MPRLCPVEAHSYASRFSLREVATWFPADARLRATKTQVIAEWAPGQAAYAFDFGALVFFDLPAERRAAILDAFAAKLPREPHAPLREDHLVEVRPGGDVEVSFDRVVVPALTPTTVDVVVTALAQSASLDYYDEDLQAILDRIGAIAAEVARRGRPSTGTRALIRFIGAAIASEVEIISSIALLDKPDATWEDEQADRLHDKLRRNLEIQERYRAIEIKLQTTREALTAFLEMTQTRRMLWLESAIVALIVFEIGMTLAALR